jgi:hypothetical protein
MSANDASRQIDQTPLNSADHAGTHRPIHTVEQGMVWMVCKTG